MQSIYKQYEDFLTICQTQLDNRSSTYGQQIGLNDVRFDFLMQQIQLLQQSIELLQPKNEPRRGMQNIKDLIDKRSIEERGLPI